MLPTRNTSAAVVASIMQLNVFATSCAAASYSRRAPPRPPRHALKALQERPSRHRASVAGHGALSAARRRPRRCLAEGSLQSARLRRRRSSGRCRRRASSPAQGMGIGMASCASERARVVLSCQSICSPASLAFLCFCAWRQLGCARSPMSHPHATCRCHMRWHAPRGPRACRHAPPLHG